MYFKSLQLTEGVNKSYDEFSPLSTLLLSKENSVGKTTYLRLLFYSLGYKIPNSYGMNFDRIQSCLTIVEKDKEIVISRSFNQLRSRCGNNEKVYSLPNDHDLFLLELFECNNISVVNNILGLMYVDQEKGWTLLNRGIVIGVNRFSIEELIAGLGKTDCGELIAKQKKLDFEISKLKAMQNIQAIKEEMNYRNGYLSFDNEGEKLNRKVCQQRMVISEIKEKISNIDDLIYQNQKFMKYIQNLRITVKNPNGGEPIIVDENNMTYANDNLEYVKSRKKLLLLDLNKEENLLNRYIVEQKNYEMSHTEISNLFEDSIDNEIILQKNINSLNFDPTNVSTLIDEYKSKLSNVKKDIKEKLNSNVELINRIYKNVYKYAEILGISNKIKSTSDFLFTDKLKDYSGTILHKLVMSFKIALHKEIESFIGISFPFVLDSPSGREMKLEHANAILKLIKDELPNSQIIIASIQGYECDKTIKFSNYAIESRA